MKNSLSILIILLSILSCKDSEIKSDFFPLNEGNYWKYEVNTYWYGREYVFEGEIDWEVIQDNSQNSYQIKSHKRGLNIWYNGYVTPARYDTTVVDTTISFMMERDSNDLLKFCDPILDYNFGRCTYVEILKYHIGGEVAKVKYWPVEITLINNVGIQTFEIVDLESNGAVKGKMQLVDYLIH